MEETKYRVEGNTIHESLGFSLKQKSSMKKKEIIDGFIDYFSKKIIERLDERAGQGFTRFILLLSPYFSNYTNLHKDINPDIYSEYKDDIIKRIIEWASDNDITGTKLDDDSTYDIVFEW